MKDLLKKLRVGRKKILYERLTEPLHLNIISIFVALFGSFKSKVEFDLVEFGRSPTPSFCITSDRSKFNNPRWLKKHEKNLKVKQQQLSRKSQGSNNKNKFRLKVAKVHLKIANCRSDFHHKLSRRIVDENQVICVENLAVANVLKNHKLAKAIQQVGWGQFCTMLKYKAEQEGKIYQEVDRFFPSSKTHNTCLYQIDSLPLDIRFWDCPNCGTKHIDRDVNAAKNIRDEGLRILNLTSGTGGKAYRQTVRRSNRGRKKSTTPLVSG